MWIISRSLVNKIFAHAQRSLPRECVGVLAGQGREAVSWHPLTNIAQGETTFLADPTEQIQLFKKLRAQDLDVVAIYHSHPKGAAFPSPLDQEWIAYPEALMLIVGMETEGRLEMNGFIHSAGVVKQQEITIRE
ncbi:MAG: M67 family metallopeptidase [Magnetococcales bacterium]|nr:M67 family metallopeptidase [Magnetococcales bacterium]